MAESRRPEPAWEPVQLEPVAWSAVQRKPFQRVFLAPDIGGRGANQIARPLQPGLCPKLPIQTYECNSADAVARRKALEICIEDDGGADIPAPIAEFEELKMIPEYVCWSLRENQFVTPMPIQAQALPLVLAGNDVIGIAQTGSGKTLAFLLPAIVQIEAQESLLLKFSVRHAPTPIALVLAPTRELAVQISDEALKVLRHSKHSSQHQKGVWATVVYGGGNKREQQQKLSWGAHILVATPGRLLDFIASKTISLERVTYFVLDEADRMLDMGFQGDVAAISGQVRPERQVLFFSATWSRDVQVLARGLCQQGVEPVRISVGQALGGAGEDCSHQAKAREGITQEVVVVDYKKEGSRENDWDRQTLEKEAHLDEYLEQALSESQEHKVLIFVSQKQFADDLCAKLELKGYNAGAMHGGRPQEMRLWVLDQFRKGYLRVLVATDVLGRGIDIPLVSHVVVIDFGGIEDYIHRIGRTARGKDGKGKALVFFEYYYKSPGLAAQLIDVLKESKQEVPMGLRAIAHEVETGKREVFDPNATWGNKSGWGSKSGWNDSKPGWKDKSSSGDAWRAGGQSDRHSRKADANGHEALPQAYATGDEAYGTAAPWKASAGYTGRDAW